MAEASRLCVIGALSFKREAERTFEGGGSGWMGGFLACEVKKQRRDASATLRARNGLLRMGREIS